MNSICEIHQHTRVTAFTAPRKAENQRPSGKCLLSDSFPTPTMGTSIKDTNKKGKFKKKKWKRKRIMIGLVFYMKKVQKGDGEEKR